MKHVGLYLLLVVAIQTSCFADVTKLPIEHRKVIQDALRFREINSVTNLPSVVVALCADNNGRIANPGQKWRATDVVTDDKLPSKRLIWAVTDDDYYVVHYESGGIGHGYHALVVKLERGHDKTSFVWHGVGERLKDFKAFLNAIERNKLDDTKEYYR